MNSAPVEILQFILDTLSNEDIETFCFAYFPQAEDEFAPGDARKIRAQKLIQYCQNRGLLENLLAALQTERPVPYEQRFHHAIPAPRATALLAVRNPRQVFISHAHGDGEFAHKLASDLRQRGWIPWITPESINPGEKWVVAIQRGLNECAVLVVVMTPAAIGSEWVHTEVESAIQLRHAQKMKLIPVLREPCEVPLLWGLYQQCSFIEGYDIGMSQLSATLQLSGSRTVDIPAQPQLTEPAVATPAGTSDSDSPEPALGVSPAIGRDHPDKGTHDVVSARTTVEVIASPEIALNAPLVSRRAVLITIALGALSAGGGLIALLASLTAPTVQPTPQVNTKEVSVAPKQPIDAPGTRAPSATVTTDMRNAPTAAPTQVQATVAPADTAAANPLLLTLAPGVMINLVRIPAGEFLMGSTDADSLALSHEKPQHKVMLDEYLIGKYDVTNAQYTVYAKAIGLNWTMPQGKENHPVVNVSWDDAVAFCAWVSQMTGRKITLPTEAQWEKAARGADGRLYPWGNEAPDNTRANFNHKVGSTTEVGKYSPKGDSPFGVSDMAGNVWQWTSSLWGNDGSKPSYGYPYNPNDGREDQNSRDLRVVRGGSWSFSSDGVRAANRDGGGPSNSFVYRGFRVVVASAPGS